MNNYYFNGIHVIVTYHESPSTFGQFEMFIGAWPYMWYSQKRFLKKILKCISKVHNTKKVVVKISVLVYGDIDKEPKTPDWYNRKEGKFLIEDFQK